MTPKLTRVITFIFLCCLLVSNVAAKKVGEAMEAGEKAKIYLGVFPYVSVNQIMKTFMSLKEYLEAEMEVDVVIVSAKNFQAI